MKIATNNIAFVKRMEHEGFTYSWFVAMKSGRVSDSRQYINYENGRTVAKEFSIDRLPASVRKFVEQHDERLFTETDFAKTFIIE